MDKKPGDATEQDRRRFAYLHAGDMWQSDVMHGPAVVVDAKRKKKTYLIAFIDDATRVIPHAAFALSENTQAFLPVFKQALLQRGLPKRLYVDNGSSYRSTQVALVCAKLNIALIHARPYQPQGKGKIERFFRTLRAQLLTRLTRQDTLSLEALNRRLLVWLQSEYHQTPHHGIDLETPLDRWAQQAGEVRYLEPQVDLDDLFLSEALRKVKSDRTVSLNGLMFEVDAIVVGESVTLRFDPGKPHAPIQVIHEGKFIGIARLVDIHANCHVKRHRPSQNSTPSTQLPASSTVLNRHRPVSLRAIRWRYANSSAPIVKTATTTMEVHHVLDTFCHDTHFPFDHSQTPETLFCASAQAEAEVRIKHLIELRGIGLITGESGSGKTSICRTIAQSLHPGLYRLLYISLTTGNVLDMYRMLAWELGLPTQRSRASAFRNIREEVTRLIVEANQLPILVIDEANHLRNDVLEDLRLLTNYNMDSDNRFMHSASGAHRTAPPTRYGGA